MIWLNSDEKFFMLHIHVVFNVIYFNFMDIVFVNISFSPNFSG